MREILVDAFYLLLEVTFLMIALGYAMYYISKKTKKSLLLKKSQNEHIHLKDAMYLSNQTSVFLFEVDGSQVFTVTNNQGIQSIQLQNNNFQKVFDETINELEGKKNDDKAIIE